jgi:hypothetical protein
MVDPIEESANGGTGYAILPIEGRVSTALGVHPMDAREYG